MRDDDPPIHATDPAIAALTPREREALRLLAQGHDIKSVAAELGLSPHTVTERLRDARRKLGTTSSREAARRLRAVEEAGAGAGGAPGNSGDRLSGDADPAAGASGASRPAPASSRRWLVAAGALVMLSTTLIAAALLSSPPAVPPVGSASQASEADRTAAPNQGPATAAAAFVARLDASDWAGAYALTADSFRAQNSPEAWAAASERARGRLGAMVAREPSGVTDLPTPPAGSVLVTYRTRYAGAANARVEKLVLVEERGAWRVVGIYVE